MPGVRQVREPDGLGVGTAGRGSEGGGCGTRRLTILIGNYTVEEMKAALSPSVKDRMREGGRAFVFDWGSFRKR